MTLFNASFKFPEAEELRDDITIINEKDPFMKNINRKDHLGDALKELKQTSFVALDGPPLIKKMKPDAEMKSTKGSISIKKNAKNASYAAADGGASIAYTNSISFEGSQAVDRNERSVPITPLPLLEMHKLNQASDNNQSYKADNTEKKPVTYTSKFAELDDYFASDDDIVNAPFGGASATVNIRRKFNKSSKKEVKKPGAGPIPSARSDTSKVSNHDNDMLVLPADSNLFVDPKPMGQLSPQRHDMLVPPSLRAAVLASTVVNHFKHSLTHTSSSSSSTAIARTGGNIITTTTDGLQGGGGSLNKPRDQSYRSNRMQHVGDNFEGDPIHAPTRGTGTTPADVNMNRLPGQHMDQEARYQSQFPLWHA